MKHHFFIALILAGLASPALAQPSTQKTGLAALLANDDAVISQLVGREMETLQQYMFKKNNIAPEQQAAYKAVISVRQLDDPKLKLTPAQQQELIANIARGIDKVLPTLSSAEELMKLNTVLVDKGEAGPLNMLEYWGEDPRTQAQLRPIAEAVAKVYQKAAIAADAERKALEAQITNLASQARIEPLWKKANQIATLARYSWACNQYTLAISIDRADKQRAEVCDAGIEAMKVFESPDYEIVATARMNLGKLLLAQGTAASCKDAKAKFAEVLKDASANWAQKFNAMYFSAAADLVLKDIPAAKQSAAAVGDWLAKNPPQGDAETVAEIKKRVDSAIDMLSFRICSVEAELAPPNQRKQADEAAMRVLQQLLVKRPDLAGIINEQIILRLPENPDVKGLPALLLKAMQRHGHREIFKEAGADVNKTAILQAIAAAKEIIRISGDASDARQKDLAATDADESALLLGFFYARLGSNVEAATAFLDYLDKYKAAKDADRNSAFESAYASIIAMRKQDPRPTEYRDVYLRFLQIATAPPFERKEFNFEYADQLLRHNNGFIDSGNYDDARRVQLLAGAQNAAELLHNAPADKLLLSRYLEMVAYDQMVDLAGKADSTRPWLARINELADEVNKLIDRQLPQAKDKDTEIQLRFYKARTIKLVAELAKHETGPNKKAAMEKALALLDNIKETVKGLPDADSMIGEALRSRIDLKMGLGRSVEAISDLEEVLKDVKTPEEALRIMGPLMQSLGQEFDRAEQQNDEARMTELATCLARVSDYVVKRAEQSTDARTKALLPEYRRFKVDSNLKAAKLTKNPSQRSAYYLAALEFHKEALARATAAARKAVDELEKDPADPAKRAKAKEEDDKEKAAALWLARMQYEVGDPESLELARRTFVEFAKKNYLGGPTIGNQFNDPYWEVTYKLLDCNARLLSGKDLETTKDKLKELYILWDNQPGGPKWTKEFDKLRKTLLPDWKPPAPGAGRATTRAT